MFDTELFIIEVNKEESIWNMKSKLYHDRVEKHVSWRRVGKVMFNDFENLTEKEKDVKVLDLQKKWKNLKDNFRRKCITKSGMAAKNAKCYTYAKVLEFLRPTMENRKTESNISSESSNEEHSDQDNEREDDILMIGSNDSEVDVQSPSTSKMYNKKIENSFESNENNNLRNNRPYSPTIRKKLKTKNNKTETSFENKLISYLHNRPKEETDPDKLFLLSLLPQIKQLSQDKKTQLFIYFLNGIQQISHISNNLQTDFHSSHSQGYSPSPSQTPLNVLTDPSPISHQTLNNINSPYQYPMFASMPQHYMQNNQNIQFSQSTHSSVNLPQNQPSTQTHHNNLPSYHEHVN
ncbi:unnamed protein product [Aphis gossypii]|uniref:MADF domain-containing protein n=1 Tax=Aphis gossypii TaxID=80765 RepID=A0A9P0IR87_APHGO|nr:unnamed protein product [Aphis gossypii]